MSGKAKSSTTSTSMKKVGKSKSSHSSPRATSHRLPPRSDSYPSNIRENLRSLSTEQEDTLARVKRLEEKLEKRRSKRNSAASSQDIELDAALDRLMKSVGDESML